MEKVTEEYKIKKQKGKKEKQIKKFFDTIEKNANMRVPRCKLSSRRFELKKLKTKQRLRVSEKS